MRRLSISALAVPLVLAFAVPAPAAPKPASVKLVGCVPAVAPGERSATFEARARAIPGAVRMQVRFAFDARRRAGAPWRRVAAPGSGEWLTSAPGVRRYSYARKVRNLAAPGMLRSVVTVRWLDAEGAVVERARVASAVCRQPDARPDLEPAGLSVEAAGGDPAIRRYAVSVRNGGRSAAGPFRVELRVAGLALAPVAVPGLEPGATAEIAFAGPACAVAGELQAIADSDEEVVERDEENNAVVALCGP